MQAGDLQSSNAAGVVVVHDWQTRDVGELVGVAEMGAAD